ncbi:MAG: hypothetical protein IAF02_05010 [Anaerolineae bacterium]|nr:hypothetical protein [Anaerolineae bacterium]
MSEKFKEPLEKEPFDYSYQEPKEQSSRQRHSPSLFGPIVLIAIGVFFLLSNLGIIQDYSFNWSGVLQLWPLFLILIGLNIVVKQMPQPLGGLLSALVGLAAVLIFGYVLLFGEDNALLNRFGVINTPTQYQIEEIDYAPGAMETAVIHIDFGGAGGDVSTLTDSRSLIAGKVAYLGDLVFETSSSGSHADVYLNEEDAGWLWLNPSNWNVVQDSRWKLGINPTVVADLRLDTGAGSVNYDLADLTLSHLQIDGSAGSATVSLPDGVYDVAYDQGAGSLNMTLPENGRQTIKLDGGAGSITLYLPAEMAARIDVDSGAGSFNPDSRFTQIDGNNNNEGIWETEDYENADNRVDLIVDIGAGSVTIREK